MCGIVTARPFDKKHDDAVRRMTDAMLHRGPDSSGVFTDTQVHMAMRRLSIIDVVGGGKPLFNEDRSVALIANGEIYNYVELQLQLAAKGHRLSTKSDCETIVHLYEDIGLDCVHHLLGMFAFALWDRFRQRLVLARDRLGEKPVYLFEQPGTLVFASELKALLTSGLIAFELDPSGVHLYFHYQYVPEPATPIKRVRKLEAAHMLVIDTNPWNVSEKCYWRMEDAPPLEGDPATLIRDELETISEIVIRSEVPVGVALSGGLDSSAVAALAVKKYPGIMHAFSVGYPGAPMNDERRDAKEFADHLGIPFHDIELEISALVDFFPELVYWQDDPIADISGFGYYSVNKLAKEHGVSVMLQGQGGDELFWGYPRLRAAVRNSVKKAAGIVGRWRGVPRYWHSEWPHGSPFVAALHQVLQSWGGLKGAWKACETQRVVPVDQLFFYDLTPDFAAASRELARLYTVDFSQQVQDTNPAYLFTLPRPWPQPEVLLTRMVFDTYLRENGVAQGDRLSMASSVELRLPLLDYKLVETVIGLRKVVSDRDLPPKAWFKEAIKDILPAGFLSRPKRGFTPPTRQWHDALFAAYGETLKNGRLVEAGILSPEGSHSLAMGPFPKGNICPLSFKALVLELWCRRFYEIVSS